MKWSPGKDTPRIGIVLSSGGTRGVYAHTGFLQAIENLGIPVHAVAGCSAGAFTGGIIASGTTMDQWLESLAQIKTRDFWTPRSSLHLLWRSVVLKGRNFYGISPTHTFRKLVENNLQAKTFEACQVPFYTVAFHLESITKKLFSTGELAPRILASSALPVLYDPVAIDNEHYCDGALVNIAPIDTICEQHELDLIIVHHSSRQFSTAKEFRQKLGGDWPLMEIIERLLYRNSRLYKTDQDVSLNFPGKHCKSPIIVLKPDLPDLDWPSVKGGMKIVEQTRQFTESRLLPHLDRILSDEQPFSPVNGFDQNLP